MKLRFIVLSLILVLGLNSPAKIKPVNLTCEYLENPEVVDVLQPRLSWINVADNGERGQTQTAWQIRVATSKDALEKADLWESKKVDGNQSIRIEYDGKKLKSAPGMLVAGSGLG